jgi:hypothetical protein
MFSREVSGRLEDSRNLWRASLMPKFSGGILALYKTAKVNSLVSHSSYVKVAGK